MDGKTKLQEYREKYPEYKDMTDAELAAGIHKKFYADMPEAEFNMRIGYSPTSAQSKDAPGYGDQLLRQLGLTARYAVEGGMTLPNMVGNAANSSINLGIKGVNAATGANIPYLMKTSDATALLLDKTGLPKPETALERVVAEPSKFIASLPAFGGIGNIARGSQGAAQGLSALADNYGVQAAGATTGGAAYGVAKELAPNSPATQLASALLGGVAGGAGLGAVANRLGATAEAVAPTTAELGRMGSSAYRAADEAGAILRPEAMQRLGQNVASELAELGYHPQLQPRIAPVLEELQRVSQGNITAKGVQTLRRIAGNAANSQDPSERMMGGMIVRQIDDLLANITPEDVVQGDATSAADAFRRAAQLWSQFRKSEAVDTAVTKGERRAATSGIGGNEENAIRQNIRAILDNPTKRRGFTADEIDAMETVVRGGTIQNFLRRLGRFSPTSSTLAGAFGLGTAATGSPLAALSAAGLVAKPVAEAMSRRNVAALSELIRGGALTAPLRDYGPVSPPGGALGIVPMLPAMGQQ